MYKYAILVAGGAGSRIGGAQPKQFREVAGHSLIWHAANAFTRAYQDIQLIFVLPGTHLHEGDKLASAFPSHRCRFTQGGTTRFESVRNGLALVDAHALVFVHDAARCLLSPDLVRRCGKTAMEKGNAVPAIQATDSLRIISGEENSLLDRSLVRIIQTPQAFQTDILKKAFEQPYEEGFTDEATVVERLGISINLIEGESTNFKVTHPIDLQLAEALLSSLQPLHIER